LESEGKHVTHIVRYKLMIYFVSKQIIAHDFSFFHQLPSKALILHIYSHQDVQYDDLYQALYEIEMYAAYCSKKSASQRFFHLSLNNQINT